MEEDSPLESPEGSWWDRNINRREAIWLGISGGWALILFSWMLGWTQFGGQNQMGETREISSERYRNKVQQFKDNSDTTTVQGSDVLVPSRNDIYIGAYQFGWDGLPVVLERGQDYKFHLSTYDVQHGFSIRKEENKSQQISLQMLPNYEWIIDMEFDDVGQYVVICNEFCGLGHRAMNTNIFVR